MNEDDIFSTWGRELSTVLDGVVEEVVRGDGYDVYLGAFRGQPILDAFRTIDEAGLTRLRDSARAFFETDAIEIEHVREAVEATVWHWTE